MASTNLSSYNEQVVPYGSSYTIGIVVAEWNKDITRNLLKGAEETLKKHVVKSENIIIKWVPGSFEIPLAAKWMAESTKFDAVICLGSVIQGETKHFDFVCQGLTKGIVEVSLETGKPVIFGVLTDNNRQQAIDRSGGKLGNKGIECAVACLKMLELKSSLR